jgi:hypothetical protein
LKIVLAKSVTMSPSTSNSTDTGIRNSKVEEQHQTCRPTDDSSNPQQGGGNLRGSFPPTVMSPPETRVDKDQLPNGAPPLGGPAAVDPAPASKLSLGHRDPRKLFVGGLPPDIAQEEFRAFFAQFGAIVDSVVMFDRETCRSRGFGFVKFLNAVSMDSSRNRYECPHFHVCGAISPNKVVSYIIPLCDILRKWPSPCSKRRKETPRCQAAC